MAPFIRRQMDDDPELTKLAQLYAEAWCSQDPEKVAAFYAKSGSISVNGGPSVPIAEVARGFMRDFPDMVVTFDKLENTPTGTEFHWTFTGTNTGPVALEILYASAATNFGKSTATDSSVNRKGISTARTTNASSKES